MTLDELKMLAAASLLSGRIRTVTGNGGRTHGIEVPNSREISEAVTVAGEIWDEICEDRNESD